MPNVKGNDKQAMERRIAEEAEYGRRWLIESELELLSLIIKQLSKRYDRPPEILENANEIVARLRKLNNE